MPITATSLKDANKSTTATIVYPGSPGRASIELRILPDGSNEAYLIPSGAAPIPTGIALIEDKGKYYVVCRKRKKRVVFKPEEVVRQKILNTLIDDFGYPEDHIELEVGVQMGSSIHEKPADIVIYSDSSKSQAWLIVETKKPNRKDGVEQLKSYMNPTGAPFGAVFDRELRSKVQSFLLGDHYVLSPGRGLGNGDELVPFIKQGVLTNAGVNWSSVAWEPGSQKTKGDVQAGDILLACTAHEVYYVGRKVDFVRDVPEEIQRTNSAVADLLVIRPRPGKPEKLYGSFVAAFLRSPAGLHQVQRCIRGLRGGHVYKSDLSQYVRVPVPGSSWLDAFEERAAAYESVRAEAKSEMQRAFQIVEQWLSDELKYCQD